MFKVKLIVLKGDFIILLIVDLNKKRYFLR